MLGIETYEITVEDELLKQSAEEGGWEKHVQLKYRKRFHVPA